MSGRVKGHALADIKQELNSCRRPYFARPYFAYVVTCQCGWKSGELHLFNTEAKARSAHRQHKSLVKTAEGK